LVYQLPVQVVLPPEKKPKTHRIINRDERRADLDVAMRNYLRVFGQYPSHVPNVVPQALVHFVSKTVVTVNIALIFVIRYHPES
jgi:hypothetical protein